MSLTFTRRRFIQTLVISISLPELVAGCTKIDYRPLAEKLTQTLARNDLAHKVAKGFLIYVEPDKKLDMIKIVESILAVLPISETDLNSIKPGPLEELLHRRIEMDFEEENVAQVVGWVLSDTEIKLCLLAYILKPSQNTQQVAG